MRDNEIITFLRNNGPSTPAKISSYLRTSLLFASAMLGEVASKGTVLMSHLKIGGGSPLYYLKEHEDRLQEFSSNLNPKVQEAYTLLQQQQVVRDNSVSPLIRVGLRNIKDFAVPLTVVIGEKQELFWKWYLCTDDDAKGYIRNILETGTPQAPAEQQTQQPTAETVEKKKEESTPSSSQAAQKTQQKAKETVAQKAPVENKEQQKEKENKKERKPLVIKTHKSHHERQSSLLSSPHAILQDFSHQQFFAEEGEFQRKIQEHFAEKEIHILSYAEVKKEKEYNFILRVPSALGTVQYFARALSKKKLNEGDLALTLLEGAQHGLPACLVSDGELNKKTEDKKEELFKDLALALL